MTTVSVLDHYGVQNDVLWGLINGTPVYAPYGTTSATVYVYGFGVSMAARQAICPLWFWLE
jgi:hypothetical protein